MSVVPIKGLFETHLTVSNLDQSIAFYSDIVGLKLAHTVRERHAAFFWIGPPGHTMLGLWSLHSSPLKMRLHIAFTVDLADLINSVERLRLAGITPRNGTDSVQIAEPVVIGWMPAASVYFDDPDGHSLELISMLPDEPRPAISHLPLSQWQKLCQVTTGVRGDT